LFQAAAEGAVGVSGGFQSFDDLTHGAAVAITAFPRHVDAAFTAQGHVKGVNA
jgi:hypothetical protein